jgi:hypothetical protein
MAKTNINKTNSLRAPRYGEIAIHCPTFLAVVKRGRITEGHLVHETSVSRNTIRSCLGLDGKGPTVNVTEKSFDALLGYVSRILNERLQRSDFECVLKDDLTELDDFRVSIRREIIGVDPRFHLIAALARYSETKGFLEDRPKACALYAALTNNIWEHKNPRAHWMCTWRQASGYVSFLRDQNDDEMAFYAGGNEGEVRDDVAMLIDAVGWRDVDELRRMVDERLFEFVKTLNLPQNR